MNRSNSEHTIDKSVVTLLRLSLLQWAPQSELTLAADREITVATSEQRLVIRRAAQGLPFRWVVVVNDRSHTASSVTGLLRHVRLALQGDYEPSSLHFVPAADASSRRAH